MDDEPFLGSRAIRAGTLTDHQLRTRYRAVYRNVYICRGATITAAQRAKAAWLWAGRDVTLVGLSAAAVLGTKWLDGDAPAEVLRHLLIRAGLPVPRTQIEFYDDYGEAFIRVDMGWRDWKVAIEYDGVQHWSDARQRAWDIERTAILEAMGWIVIRISAAMLSRPDVLIERVRAKLRSRGCPV